MVGATAWCQVGWHLQLSPSPSLTKLRTESIMPGKRSVAASADNFESGHTGIYTDSAVAPHDFPDIVGDDNEGSDHPTALTL
jgi:hypothetical protein